MGMLLDLLLDPSSPVPICSNKLTLAVTFSGYTRTPASCPNHHRHRHTTIAFTTTNSNPITIFTITMIIMMMM